MIKVCGRYPSRTGNFDAPQAPILRSENIVVDETVHDYGVNIRLDDDKYPEMWLEVKISAEKIQEWAEKLHCTKKVESEEN